VSSPLALHLYQEVGAAWLSKRPAALLADKQRLGKSAQSIRACDLVGAKRILIICRAVARENWENEFKKFTLDGGRQYRIIFSASDVPAETDDLSKTVLITSYEGLGHLLGALYFHFDAVIVDESHYLKSTNTKRSKQVFGVDGICRRTKYIWCLTGTPTPNNASELWTTLYTFGATKLSYIDFVGRFCTTRETGFGLQITGTNTSPERLKELQAILKKCVLRREEKDVAIELPKMTFTTEIVEPGPVELSEHELFVPYVLPYDNTKALAEKLQKEMGILHAIVNGKYASHELVEILKAEAQSVSTLRRFTALQKMEPICEIIRDDLKNNAYKKCVIFAIHQSIIEGMKHRLQEFEPLAIYGGTRPSRVGKYIRRFQSPSDPCRVMIGNIHAAGTSISLTSAHHIFFVEEAWTPGDNAQAAMRCGGVNQKNPVFVRTFALNNSVDQAVQALLKRKMEEQAKIWESNPTIQELI
jgi:SWI/SNF-related matrix-associated actin-dependent regulator 1 of chromatin subfamily A